MQKRRISSMFTGIIESIGTISEVIKAGSNKSFWINSPIANELKVDQSLSHDGVCLTVEEINGERYKVTAIIETLEKTNLKNWKPGSIINLERSLKVNSLLDGHFVQGHIDTTGICKPLIDRKGSWDLTFSFSKKFAALIIEKGSIAINGVSLTVFNVKKKTFTVSIIPYTWSNTNLQNLNKGDLVNLEFDLIGKYIQRKLSLKASK